MKRFRPKLEALDARIVPDASPIAPPTLPPAQGGLDWQQLLSAATLAYLGSLEKIQNDIAAVKMQKATCDTEQATLNNAKADLATAAVADKPALQVFVDFWQAQVETANAKLQELVYQYRDDRYAATALFQQLLTLDPNADVPSLKSERFLLDSDIDDLVPLRIFPNTIY